MQRCCQEQARRRLRRSLLRRLRRRPRYSWLLSTPDTSNNDTHDDSANARAHSKQDARSSPIDRCLRLEACCSAPSLLACLRTDRQRRRLPACAQRDPTCEGRRERGSREANECEKRTAPARKRERRASQRASKRALACKQRSVARVRRACSDRRAACPCCLLACCACSLTKLEANGLEL